jgi:hypothetical protein
MKPMSDKIREQIEDAYRRMAEEGKYRPAAPSDGFGGLLAEDESELDLDAEAADYAQRWWPEEDLGEYHIGVPGFERRPALIFAVEAARISNGAGSGPHAARLLRMAADELDGG